MWQLGRAYCRLKERIKLIPALEKVAKLCLNIECSRLPTPHNHPAYQMPFVSFVQPSISVDCI
jgi:hypothetical protein